MILNERNGRGARVKRGFPPYIFEEGKIVLTVAESNLLQTSPGSSY